MRGLLIFLALAAPFLLTNPLFWELVKMNFGKSEITYHHKDGTRQRAWLGPGAPWPEWAFAPEGSDMTVRSHFESAPGRPATGVADISGFGMTVPAIARYRSELERAGWQVTAQAFDTAEPSLPPRAIRTCRVVAVRPAPDTRVIRATFVINEERNIATIHWGDRPLPTWQTPPGPPIAC